MRLCISVLLLFSCFCASANDPPSPSWHAVINRFEYAVRTLFVPELSKWDCRACTSQDAARARHDTTFPLLHSHNVTLDGTDENSVVRNRSNLETQTTDITSDAVDSDHATDSVDTEIQTQRGIISLHQDVSHTKCVGVCLQLLSSIKVAFTQMMSASIDVYTSVARTVRGIFTWNHGEEQNESITNDNGIVHENNTADAYLWPDLLLYIEETYIQKKATLTAAYVNMVKTVRSLFHTIATSLFSEQSHVDTQTGYTRRRYDPSKWTLSSLFWKNEMHGPHMLVAGLVSERHTVDNAYDSRADAERGTLRQTWILLYNRTGGAWSYLVEDICAMLTTISHNVDLPSAPTIPDSDTQDNLYSLLLERMNGHLSLTRVWLDRAWKTIVVWWQPFLMFKYELLLMAIACLWILACLHRERNTESVAVCRSNDLPSDDNENKLSDGTDSGIYNSPASNLYVENYHLCRQYVGKNSSPIDNARDRVCVGHSNNTDDDKNRMLKEPTQCRSDSCEDDHLCEQSAPEISDFTLGENITCNNSIRDLMFVPQPCTITETQCIMQPQHLGSNSSEVEHLLTDRRQGLQVQCNDKKRCGFRDTFRSVDSSDLQSDAVLGLLLKDIGALTYDRGDCKKLNNNSVCNGAERGEHEPHTLDEGCCDVSGMLVNTKDSTNNSIHDPMFTIASNSGMGSGRHIPAQHHRKFQLDTRVQCSIKQELGMCRSEYGNDSRAETVLETKSHPSVSETNGITRKSLHNELNLQEKRMRHKRSGRAKLNNKCLLDSQEHVCNRKIRTNDLNVHTWKGENGRYREVKRLSGTSGQMFIVETKPRKRNMIYLLKVSKEKHNRDFSPAGDVRVEIMMLRHLRHPNILTSIDRDSDRANFLVSRYFENRDLHYFYKHHPMPYYTSQYRIIHGLASAVDYIHTMHYAHRSIQPEHVLLDGRLEPRLCGFGFASYCLNKDGVPFHTTERLGPLAYSPSETFGLAKHDPQMADVFSLGATFFYAIRGKDVFKGKLFLEEAGKNSLPESWCLHLIKRMTSNPPENRPDAKDVLQLVQHSRPSSIQKD